MENQNAHLKFNYFSRENREFMRQCGKIWYSLQSTDDKYYLIWHIIFACFISSATDTHSEYVAHIAFPLQKRLGKRAVILRYT